MSHVHWAFVDDNKKVIKKNSGICYAELARESLDTLKVTTYLKLWWPSDEHKISLTRKPDRTWWKFLNTVPFYKKLLNGMSVDEYNKGLFIPIDKYNCWEIFMFAMMFRYMEEHYKIVESYHGLKTRYPKLSTLHAFYLAHKDHPFFKNNAKYSFDVHLYFGGRGSKAGMGPIEDKKWKDIIAAWPTFIKPYKEVPDFYSTGSKRNNPVHRAWEYTMVKEGGSLDAHGMSMLDYVKTLFPKKHHLIFKDIT